MLIKDIDSLFRFHWNDENKMLHLDKMINKNKNVLINNSHKNIEKKKSHIIHENTALIMLKRRQELKSILIILTKRLELSINVIITNKMTRVVMRQKFPQKKLFSVSHLWNQENLVRIFFSFHIHENFSHLTNKKWEKFSHIQLNLIRLAVRNFHRKFSQMSSVRNSCEY